MASLLNNASLLFNPAGSIISYQEDKIYSVLPRNGDGDFTFSGGDGGTRVNQQGYIEQTPANLAFQSNAFSTSPWSRQNTTLTSGQSDPLGGTNAWKVEFSAAQAFLYQYTSPITGVVTISAYLRADSTTTIGFNDGAGNPNSVTIGTTWKLYTFTYTVSSVYYIIQFDNYFGVSPANQAKTFYVYGAQLNIGSTAKPYQPTTDRLNYPRITYQNGRGALLQEPQRTNLWVQSQNFATYGVYRFTQTLNAAISPDGTQNASKIVETATAGTHQYEPSFSATSGQAYTVSVFAKAAERTQLHIFAFADNNVFNNTDAFYDLAAGTVISGTGASIEKWPDGWYRCIRTMTAGATGTGYWGIGIAVNGGASYTGDGSSGIYMWGGQNEAGSYPTSYIPTTSATVTRPAESGLNFDSSVNDNNFTLYYNGSNTFNDSNYFDILVGTNTTAPFPGIYAGWYNGFNSIWDVGGGLQVGNIAVPPGTLHKFALKYDGTNLKYFTDGVLKQTTSAPGLSTFRSGQVYNSDSEGLKTNTLAYFTSALTDAQLQELTTVRSGSGGTISYYGPYTIHTFTGSATFTPSFSGEVEVLVVAGGGGGGVCYGGGGGAGGVLYASSYGVSQGTGITVTIGSGGTNQVNVVGNGGPGGNSSFGGLTAIGGGYGGGVCGNIGGNGGSGGGGSGTGGSSTAGGIGIPGQGNNGNSSIVDGGGGGGGAGTGNLSVNRQGGDGLPYSITGFSTYYGGGGSGGGGTLLAGGLGGGGKGGIALASGVADATPYTGGGGGGSIISGTGVSGLGGAGIVIVRYLT